MNSGQPLVSRWPDGRRPSLAGPSGLLAAYHLRTESEKGAPVPGVAQLPERYRIEVEDPGAAFAEDTLLVAWIGDAAVGCVVVTAVLQGRAEIKRLWVEPSHRGQGIASTLLDAALEGAATSGAEAVQLTVWRWRQDAIALYRRHGFTVTGCWDQREGLTCMERGLGTGDRD